MLSECKVIPVIPLLLDHPVPKSSPFSPLTHGQKIATMFSGDSGKKTQKTRGKAGGGIRTGNLLQRTNAPGEVPGCAEGGSASLCPGIQIQSSVAGS